MELIIGNKNYSTWSLRPWLFMQQNQMNFVETKIHIDHSNPYTDDKLKDHFSAYKVPLLLDGDLQVWDSLAIMEYLAETDASLSAWPKDPKARAVARSVSAEMHSSFMALRGALPMNCRKFFKDYSVDADVLADVQRIEDIWQYCAQYKTEGDWLFGAFSIADAMYAPVVLRLVGYDITVSESAKKYINFVMQNLHIKAWVEAGKKETKVIPEDEV